MRHLTHLNYIHIVAKEGSIRKAAEKLSITSTALNRRILALEEEIGSPLFERLPTGVRLNTAGELFIQHIRYQMQDLSRVLSHIADLSGVRRGHVTISMSAELSGSFLAREIAQYRQEHPAVSFDIVTQTPEESTASLSKYEADIAFIFGEVALSDITLSATVTQSAQARMSASHPLAEHPSLSLEDIFQYPVVMPKDTTGLYNQILMGASRKSLSIPALIKTDDFGFMQHYIREENAICFHIPLANAENSSLSQASQDVSKVLKTGECPLGVAHIACLKGRTLPVSAARFLDQLVFRLHQLYPETAN